MSFTDAGKFTYKCLIYTWMKGCIEVLDNDQFSNANRRKSFQHMANQLNLPMVPMTQTFNYNRTRNQDLNQ